MFTCCHQHVNFLRRTCRSSKREFCSELGYGGRYSYDATRRLASNQELKRGRQVFDAEKIYLTTLVETRNLSYDSRVSEYHYVSAATPHCFDRYVTFAYVTYVTVRLKMINNLQKMCLFFLKSRPLTLSQSHAFV